MVDLIQEMGRYGDNRIVNNTFQYSSNLCVENSGFMNHLKVFVSK